jgi:ribosome-associated protein
MAADPGTLNVNRRIQIPRTEFRWTFSRSGGPGGQNVNKVNSKVTLHWPIRASASLPDDVRSRLEARYASRINQRGELVIQSERYRDQGRNIADCLDKLRSFLTAVATAPKRRIATRPGRAARQRRLNDKKSRGQTKQLRRRPAAD